MNFNLDKQNITVTCTRTKRYNTISTNQTDTTPTQQHVTNEYTKKDEIGNMWRVSSTSTMSLEHQLSTTKTSTEPVVGTASLQKGDYFIDIYFDHLFKLK